MKLVQQPLMICVMNCDAKSEMMEDAKKRKHAAEYYMHDHLWPVEFR